MLTRRRLPHYWTDALIASAFAGIAVVESVATSFDDGSRAGPVWLNVVLGVLLAASLAWRRVNPPAAYVSMLAVLIVPSAVTAHSMYLLGTMLPLCVGAFTAARYSDGIVARFAWLAALVPPVVLHQRTLGAAVSDIAFLLVFLGSAWASGRTMRRFDVQGQELRTTLRAIVEEESAREEEAVDVERRRIAAEMHDVVAHAVSLMVVQIGSTRMETQDATDAARLRAAEDTGRQALVELRRSLGLLTSGAPALAPLPDHNAIPALIDQFRSAGLNVTAHLDLDAQLPAGLGLTAFRVVQEALTNALKHGGREEVDVRVTIGRDLRIEVTNDIGSDHALPSGGHGLIGMRERVAVYGGTLTAAADNGRFSVRAIMPLSTLEVAS